MRKYLILILLMSLQMVARGQTMDVLDSLGLPHPTTAKSMRYWIDDDAGSVKTTNMMEGLHSVDVSSVLEGLHTIHYQIIDSENNVCAPYSGIFLALNKGTQTNASTLRYWFDDDNTKVMTCSANAGVQTLDVSMLLEGLHTLHYQVIDTEGKVSYIASNIFIKMGAGAISANASTLRYWFDDDNTKVMTCSTNAGVQTLDVSTLLDGLHTLHYQVIDTEGKASYIASNIFMKIGGKGSTDKVTANKLIYWFDDEENTNTIGMSNGMQVIDASALLDGLHTIHYQVICSDGTITSAYSSIFMRMSVSSESSVAKSIRYWFDDEQEATDIAITSGIQTLDASHLLDGLHTVHYQLIDDRGVVATPMSNIFMKMTGGASTSAQSLRYWFDDETEVRTTDVAGGTQSIDVSDLMTGLHTLHYQLVDDKGDVCAPVSGLFMKMFDNVVASGENVITQYTYWMNDNSADNKKVEIDNPSSPYKLVALLPMIKAPIRSTSFHFETKDGVPTVYAKNDLHVRFTDAAGYWVDDARSFIDYSVSQKVDVAKVLTEESGKETFSAPSSNTITWYSMECEKGDSISLNTSQATSIQIFAPSGNEVYNVSGSESIKLGGIHAREEGTYYLAIHDVTGSRPDMTLSYQHIDKYAVLAQDVRVVGNGGCSTITFQGNGFNNLYAVDLYTAQGDTIHSVDVGHESDAETTITFDFADTALGKYNAKFRFADEDKVFANNITVEEAKEIELDTKVSYPSTFLRGTSVTYTVEITNKGNMTAYDVPVYISLGNIEIKNVSKLKIDNARKLDINELIDESDIEISKKDSLKQYYSELGDKSLFVQETQSTYLSEDMSKKLYCFVWKDLSPETTEVLSVTLESTKSVSCWFNIPVDWSSIRRISNSSMQKAKSSVSIIQCLTGKVEQYIHVGKQGFESHAGFKGAKSLNTYQLAYTTSDTDSESCFPHKPLGGFSTPVNSLDPNDIYGYIHESGSKFINDSIRNVNYRIEFENDTTFATASAHTVIVRDTLDATRFNLSSYQPTSIKIGDKVEYLDGTSNFVKTVDMRPTINAIAQVEGSFDEKKGIATWKFTSLDPMTMEETDDVMQGFLPINFDGNGIGEVAYNINLLQGLADGTAINNRASIVFDSNDPILTPMWTNIVDTIAPTSSIEGIVMRNDSIYDISFKGEDNRSGIWKYTLYVQQGVGSSWIEVATDIAPDSIFTYHGFDCIDYGFCAVATDMAGNVEKKVLVRETATPDGIIGDVDGDGVVTIADAKMLANYLVGIRQKGFKLSVADVDGDGKVSMVDANMIVNLCLKSCAP